jgi:uncharacterized protein YyaL (SSP411 family)
MSNKLIHSTSPYLLQHAQNPVDWFPWSDEALEKAKRENKLLIISIGYSACHWCHVMEHESFEDKEVAKVMNEGFVSIKVDREERPDIDHVYMNAVQIITGQGGWPLNAIALPDGRPIYAGTYFPKSRWIQVLKYFHDIYRDEPHKVFSQAEKIANKLQILELVEVIDPVDQFPESGLKELWNNWKHRMDYEWGGRQGAPKFMMPNNYEFLLMYNHYIPDKEVEIALKVTLDRMAKGGLYDHVGGGFARYSVDEKWHVPHFEKMLYDNAQLVSLYSNAYLQFKNPLYKEVVDETLIFIEREMTDASGGFYAALDADSEGVEGKYYVWSDEEIDKILGDNSEIFKNWFSVSEEGNWEETNVLFNYHELEEVAKAYKLSISEFKQIIKSSKEKLLFERQKRIAPGLDDKILLSWNALMLKGYVDAYHALGNELYLQKALSNAHFIKKNMIALDSSLYRNFKNGKATINAFLDDYACLIDAYIALYQATFEEEWLLIAQSLANYTLEHFYNDGIKMFYYTSNSGEKLASKTIETSDNVISSSNSIMCKVLFILGHYFDSQQFIDISKQSMSNLLPDVIRNGSFYANWAQLLIYFTYPTKEIAIVGENFLKLKNSYFDTYKPNVLLMGSMDGKSAIPLVKNKFIDGKTLIYICQNKTCSSPVEQW